MPVSSAPMENSRCGSLHTPIVPALGRVEEAGGLLGVVGPGLAPGSLGDCLRGISLRVMKQDT